MYVVQRVFLQYQDENPTGWYFPGKCPLYWQHEGHSRTIIGVERQTVGSGVGAREETRLLVLDPQHSHEALVAALKARRDWARMVKRGAGTLRHLQYQLLYVAAGIARDEQERAALKTISASERFC